MKMKAIAITFMTLLQVFAAPAHAGVTKEEFDSAIKRIHTIYSPKVATVLNAKLVIDGKWEDASVNAYTQKLGDRFILNVLGGIAKHPKTTPDALMLIVCDELGHVLGGDPKSVLMSTNSSWASLMGQSDYFATAKCLKKVFESDNNIEIIKALDVPVVVAEKCNDSFKNANSRALCIRSSMAGKDVADLLNSLTSNENVIKFGTPSQVIVSKTLTNHPPVQCRLDTFFAGAVCDSNLNDDHDLNFGFCENGSAGARPLCWYKP
jgi:hypothetical protein